LAMIGSLQSTDVGASLTRALADDKQITEREKDVFTMFQFSAGAMLVNFFSSGAVLFTLVGSDGNLAVPASIGTCVAVMFVMKIVGANLFRIYLKATEGKGDSESDTTKPAQTNA
ncbi:MAG: nucleoside recognition domain-containing protein, partial [Plesiomonas shigelloides]